MKKGKGYYFSIAEGVTLSVNFKRVFLFVWRWNTRTHDDGIRKSGFCFGRITVNKASRLFCKHEPYLWQLKQIYQCELLNLEVHPSWRS